MLALGPLWTETNEPIGAHHLPHVPALAVWSMLAKPASIPGTLLDL